MAICRPLVAVVTCELTLLWAQFLPSLCKGSNGCNSLDLEVVSPTHPVNSLSFSVIHSARNDCISITLVVNLTDGDNYENE